MAVVARFGFTHWTADRERDVNRDAAPVAQVGTHVVVRHRSPLPASKQLLPPVIDLAACVHRTPDGAQPLTAAPRVIDFTAVSPRLTKIPTLAVQFATSSYSAATYRQALSLFSNIVQDPLDIAGHAVEKTKKISSPAATSSDVHRSCKRLPNCGRRRCGEPSRMLSGALRESRQVVWLPAVVANFGPSSPCEHSAASGRRW